MTDKQLAFETVGRLPETVTLQEISEKLQVLAAIRQGQADIAAGRVRSHEEVERLFSTWSEQWATKSLSSS